MNFELHMLDNGSHMVGSCDELDPQAGCPSCPRCGYRTDKQFTATNFVLRSKRFDISCCYDGAIIASSRFKRVCERFDTRAVQFVPLIRENDFFHLRSLKPVKMDYKAMGTRFERKCRACGLFRDVIGVSEPTLASGQRVSRKAIVMADEYFGSNNEAIPMLIVGGELFEALDRGGVTGLDSVTPVRTAAAQGRKLRRAAPRVELNKQEKRARK
jgi:hypothetical protein